MPASTPPARATIGAPSCWPRSPSSSASARSHPGTRSMSHGPMNVGAAAVMRRCSGPARGPSSAPPCAVPKGTSTGPAPRRRHAGMATPKAPCCRANAPPRKCCAMCDTVVVLRGNESSIRLRRWVTCACGVPPRTRAGHGSYRCASRPTYSSPRASPCRTAEGRWGLRYNALRTPRRARSGQYETTPRR